MLPRPLLLSLAVLIQLLTATAKADTNSQTQLTVQLTDGSRLIGTPDRTTPNLEIATESFGTVTLPWTRLTSLELRKETTQTLVRLANGDLLRGQVKQPALKMATLFGRLSIPFPVIVQIQVRQAGEAGRALTDDDWDALPFPITCDWPGPKGQPSIAVESAVELRGHPVRTKTAVPFPCEWQCEVRCLSATPQGATLHIYFFAPGPRREAEPNTTLLLSLSGELADGALHLRPILYQAIGNKRQSRELWAGRSQQVEIGKPYPLRIAFGDGQARVTFAEASGVAEGVTADYREAHIQLWNWQPTTQWVVKNPYVR